MNAHYDEQLMVTLIEHVKTRYPNLETLQRQLDLTLFNLLTPSVIQNVDSYVGSNPAHLVEALSLKEYADVISMFYGVESFSERITKLIISTRSIKSELFDKNHVLHPQFMQEYFSDRTGLETFTIANPVFVGIYIYLIATM